MTNKVSLILVSTAIVFSQLQAFPEPLATSDPTQAQGGDKGLAQAESQLPPPTQQPADKPEPEVKPEQKPQQKPEDDDFSLYKKPEKPLSEAKYITLPSGKKVCTLTMFPKASTEYYANRKFKPKLNELNPDEVKRNINETLDEFMAKDEYIKDEYIKDE